ncbi:hypothetical protein HBI56_193440 [Parastagonospora nodorum]|uniref:Uncharacterized protein n=1 Tax=Phaeosphaeria nodorum (strain SN15 / ATCC MYA-4574 / FGSC 10173) TaxID=321614 RepID=A0A7U2HXY9_PHANO|nr:hypothetical protein HBH56_205080 [Parastagonospora nodorum]QRC94798.1 hypothetical protein JI435_406360 [Parastagonospora nodorum SN15]KAH3923796.1 hypothetical protein HBH54_203950 [Parastagonospora nodorum]KAH3942278.1 hypothetical protein HBH53_190380 [Parastagonospora nodorum]KAH3962254.1 hypothetical protein HBH51_175250 [Parastagonospora nodorum]
MGYFGVWTFGQGVGWHWFLDMLRHLGGMIGLCWRSSLVSIAMQFLNTSILCLSACDAS